MRQQMLGEENKGRRNATICDKHFGSFSFFPFMGQCNVGTAYVRFEQDEFTVKDKYAMKKRVNLPQKVNMPQKDKCAMKQTPYENNNMRH